MDKQQVLALNREHICPHRVDVLSQLGIDFVVGKREGGIPCLTRTRRIRLS